MITGIGVDVVGIPRFERVLERSPGLLLRLFAPDERTLAPRSLAARFAAKEALVKALGGPNGMRWTDVEVVGEPSGRPAFSLRGPTADVVTALGITALHLSITRDGGVAVASVIAEAGGPDIDRRQR
ncbi:holo-ACP synthase [Rathayibacter sp. VKM Ac-2759]|uniref:holo-ACP synthase n=1 Tax=Rathayibacter sp. VKM Ac-2759 TaxID=2609252 RepID=UPI001318AC73|nr:holo-ACP synthase [Rathayibacter sp. VKM Ac-2759]QHC66689.1 holo-ACP synthase [Rathayibacter sp. VKM Ac-2759]